MASKQQTIDVPVLRRAAMDFLARREHSRYELLQKLLRKYPDVDAEKIDDVIRVLQDENLQSDERFAESYVRYRKSRGFGLLHIQSDLQGRRVSESTIASYLYPDDEDWLLIAEELTVRRFGECRIRFGSKEHQRHLRFLQSRGFSAREIRSVMDKRLDFSGPVHTTE